MRELCQGKGKIEDSMFLLSGDYEMLLANCYELEWSWWISPEAGVNVTSM